MWSMNEINGAQLKQYKIIILKYWIYQNQFILRYVFKWIEGFAIVKENCRKINITINLNYRQQISQDLLVRYLLYILNRQTF